MPPVIVAVIAFIAEYAVAAQIVFMIASSVYGSAAQRRAAKKAREAAKSAYNAGLEDKQLTGVGTEMPVRYVYGQDKVGAVVVAMFTTGDKDEFRHLVCVLANHEVTSIDEVYINGKNLGTLASDGSAQINSDSEVRILRGNLLTYKLPSTYSNLVVSASSNDGATYSTLTLTTHYTITDNTLTILSPYNTNTYLIKVACSPNYFVVGSTDTHTLDITTPLTLPSDYSGLQVYSPTGSSGTDEQYIPLQLSYTLAGLVLTPSEYPARVVYMGGNSTSRVKCQKHLGGPADTADAYLIAQVSHSWTSNHILRGHAYIILTLDLNQSEFQGGVPQIQALVTGKKVYDPRKDSTVSGGSGAHRYTDSTTWAWSNNPALCILDYVTSPLVGLAKTDLTGVFAFYQTAANVCEETITINGTSAYKYTLNGVVNANEDAATLLDKMADSMAGVINGTDWSLYAGKYVAPVVSLYHMDDVVGALAVTTGLGKAEIFNTVRGRFTGPENDYAPTDFKPYIDSTYKTADSSEELVLSAEFPFTNQTQRVHNLCAILLEDNRNGVTISGDFSYKAWRLRPGDRVYFYSPPYTGRAIPVLLGMDAKVFRVVDKQFKVGEAVKLTLKEDASSIWDVASAVTLKASPTTNLPDPYAVPEVTGFTAQSGDSILLRDTSGTIITRIKFTWDRTTYLSSVYVEIQYQRHTETSWSTQTLTNYETSTYINGVNEGNIYVARIRFINPTINAIGPWTYLSHTVIGKTTPPPPFDSFLVLAQPDGTRQFNFSYTTTTPPVDWAGAEIRYVSGTVGSPNWSTMTRLQDSPTFYTASPVETNSPTSGTWTFACCSMDTTGNYSTLKIQTITLPERRTGSVFFEYSELTSAWPGTKSNLTALPADMGLEGTDTRTWTSKGTWASEGAWNNASTTSATYTSVVHDLGALVSGLVDASITVTGSYTLEMRTSPDNSTWSSYGSVTAAFSARYVQFRVSLTTTAPTVITITDLSYSITADLRTEYVNDVVTSALTGSYRIGTGDIRVPLVGTYTYIKRVSIIIQDSSAGSWTYQRIDNNASPGPRFQFKLSGTLTDPAFVDFFVEGV